ncbi:MAG: hypothetical protein ABEJ23_03225 [Haloarculaceae archaeon]
MSGDAPGGDDGDGGGVSRRTLVRLLIALGFGVPILVEGVTFLGLVDNWVGGDQGTATPSRRTPRPVGQGDELLPETAPTDRIVAATVEDTPDGREMTLVVSVENQTDASYQLQLSRLLTTDDEQIEGGGSTDMLGPGESQTVTGRWSLPAGARPAAVEVVGVIQRSEGNSNVVRRVVPLAVSEA